MTAAASGLISRLLRVMRAQRPVYPVKTPEYIYHFFAGRWTRYDRR